MSSYGVVRIRGTVDASSEVEDTLEMLNLDGANSFTVVPREDTYTGMVNKVDDYVAYGEPSPSILARLLEGRGETVEGEPLDEEHLEEHGYGSFDELAEDVVEGETKLRDAGVAPTIRLHPPRRGHGGIKHSYKEGGVLGNHGDDIDELLRRMR